MEVIVVSGEKCYLYSEVTHFSIISIFNFIIASSEAMDF